MSNAVMEIYRQRVLEHSRSPHNLRQPATPDRQVTGFNPLCGDKLTVYMLLDGDTVSDVCFDGIGCAICMASASMMTDALAGLSLQEAERLIEEFDAMFADGAVPVNARLDETRALENVRAYPSRIKCATLPWSTAKAALHNDSGQITTE